MTTETTRDYETLEPRALDALVAERVFGLVQCTSAGHDGEDAPPRETCYAQPDSPSQGGDLWMYSEDVAAAFTVLEAMRATGYGYTIEGHVAPYVKIWRPGAENARPGTSFRDIAFARAAVIEALRGLDEFEVAG
jgi:hypothetical protein